MKNEEGKSYDHLLIHHQKRMHVMIVSEDLAEYDHIHPIRTGKRTYEIKKALKPGTYKAFDDLKPENGRYEVKPDVLQAGNKAKKYPPALKSDTDSKQSSGEFTVELNPKCIKLFFQ